MIKEIGRYIVEEKIGQGAMGEVYRALDSRIHRIVAVKTLRLSKFGTEDDKKQAISLILKEARITGQLNHGYIATIYDMGIHQGIPFFVMEYIKGSNLKELIVQQAKFSLKEKLGIVSMVAQALHYAHQRGVLHRDIKPANIMILGNGTPKITDFGIASLERGQRGKGLVDIPDDSEQNEILLAGTPHFMAPEQISRRAYDARSDIYSLGVVAYEWISGQRAFSGKDMQEVIAAVCRKVVQPLAGISDVGTEVESIIHKAMEKKPELRYQNAEEFSDAIEMYLNSLEVQNPEVLSDSLLVDKSQIIARLRKKYVFFADFSEDELSTIFRLSQRRNYIAGEYIIREKTVGRNMFVILSGQVSIQSEADGQDVEIERLGAGSCVGEMALVDKMERSASVIALEPTLAIAINDTVLRLSNPALCLKLYRSLAALLSEKLRGQDERYRKLLSERPAKNERT